MESVNFEILTLSDQILDFCERNGISREELDSISKLEGSKNITNINSYIDWYGIRDLNSPSTEEICVKDIVGWTPCKKNRSLFAILGSCYSDGHETYHIRDNDKLRLNKDEMLENMKKTLDYEPICVDEIEGKNIVSTNGCHRTSILKLLYLADSIKGTLTPEELDKKYKIKAKVTKYDMTLTYMHYFLKQMGVISHIGIEYDSSWSPTGNYKVDTQNGLQIMSKDNIIGLFNESLNMHADKIDTWSISLSLKIPSFKEFMENYAPTLIKEDQYGSLN